MKGVGRRCFGGRALPVEGPQCGKKRRVALKPCAPAELPAHPAITGGNLL